MKNLVAPILLATVLILPSAVFARCNGHLTQWCFDHYWNQRNAASVLRRQMIGVLESLPAQIQAANQTRAAQAGDLNALNVQIPWAQTETTRLDQELPLYERWITLAQEASADLKMNLRQSPLPLRALVRGLQVYLAGSQAQLGELVRLLEAQIRQTPPHSSARGSLTQIRNELRKLTQLPRTEVLTGLEPGHPPLPQISGDLQALLRTARDASAAALQQTALQARLLDELDALITESREFLRTTAQHRLEARSKLEQLQYQSQALTAQVEASDARIRALGEDLTTRVPQAIAAATQSEANSDVYWHCCDNEPFCHLLPDWDRQNDHRNYEADISPIHHAEVCKRGGDL